MKKAKLMLLTLALFAILGGTLAFKIKVSTVDWCSTTTELDEDEFKTGCPLLVNNKKVQAGIQLLYATSRDVVGDPISGVGQCANVNLTCVKVRLTND